MGHRQKRSRSLADGPVMSENVPQAMSIVERELDDESLDAGKILALEQKSPVLAFTGSHSPEALQPQGFDG